MVPVLLVDDSRVKQHLVLTISPYAATFMYEDGLLISAGSGFRTDPFTPKIVSSIKLRVSSVLDVRGSQSKETHEHHSRPLLHGNKKVEPAYMGGDYFFDHLPCVQEPSEKVTGLYLIGFIET
jgi:hypothetical protein